MPMESIKLLRDKYIIIFLFLLTACSNADTDYRLTKFEFIDKKLDSLTVEFTEGINKKISRDSMFVGLSLNLKNDTIVFEYSMYTDIYAAKKYNVLAENRRVIGYTEKGNVNILLFSDINNYNDMIYTLSKLIKPTKEYRIIDLHNEYINYEEWGGGYMIDKQRVCFDYYEGRIGKVYFKF